MDCSPPDSSVHGILQARILHWVAIPFSRGSSQLRNQTQVSLIAGNCLPAELPNPGIELRFHEECEKYENFELTGISLVALSGALLTKHSYLRL